MAQIPKVPSAGSWTKQPSAGDVSSTGGSPSGAGGMQEASGSLRSGDADTRSGVGFGSGTDGSIWCSESSSIHVTKAPEGLLYVALTAAVVAIALSALCESVVVAGIGWVLAVLVGLGAATVFVVQNAKRQTSPWYLYSSRPQLLYRLSVLLCFLAIAATSVRIALFVGRM